MSSGTKKNGVLSFSKVAQLLSSRSYTLVAIYSEQKTQLIRFLEIRTPKIQKTFIISIPEKYKMNVNTDAERYRNIQIAKVENLENEERQIEYITEVKGPLLECDLLSISSSLLCLAKNNGENEIYKFGGDNLPEEDHISEDSELEDPVENIIKSAKKITKKVSSKKFKIEGSEQEEEKEVAQEILEIPEGEEENDVGNNEVEDEPDQIELVFEDENGNQIDGNDAQALLEEEIIIPEATKKVEEEIEKLETAIERASPESTPTEILNSETQELTVPKTNVKRKTPKDNAVPENIEDIDITLGIIYYCVEIGLFNKKVTRVETPAVKNGVVPSFEEEVVKIHDIIDDNEAELRDIKLDEIFELSSKLTIKAKEEMEECKKEEMNLKSQILKLTSVLEHCEKLRIKTENKPEKFTEVKPEIERLYKQTKTTLYEINVEILRNKDRADDILNQYKTSLEELLKL